MTAGKGENAVDKRVGARIRQLRVLKNMSQEAFAAELGISYQQLQKNEHGKNAVPLARLFKIADVLGCTVSDLLKIPESDDETAPPSLSVDALRVAAMFDQIETPEARKIVKELVTFIAD